MGTVFRGRHRSLGVVRAVKVLEVGHARPAAAGRFAREVAHLAQVRHPNVVAVHDAGEEAGWAYYAMDLVEGQPLDRVLERGPLPVDRALELIAAIAEGVAALHAIGVVHRDLKPQNVVLRADGAPVVLDLGLAVAPALDERLTRTGAMVGTPHYMAPEQLKGAPPDPRMDVYALGLILFELTTGQQPLEGASTPHEVLARVLTEQAPLPSSVDPTLPAGLDRLCARLSAREPQQRPPDAAAVAQAVAALRAAPPERPVRRRGLRVLAAGLLVAATAAGYLWQERRDAPTGSGLPQADSADALPATPPASPPAERSSAEAERRLEELRRTRDDRARFAAAAAWLTAFPQHPQAPAVERLRDEAALTFPHARYPGETLVGFVRGDRWLTLVRWTLALRSVGEDAPLRTWRLGGRRHAAAIDPAGERVALAIQREDGVELICIDVDQEREVRRWRPAAGVREVTALAFSRDGRRLAVAGDGAAGSAVEEHALAADTPPRTVARHDLPVSILAYEPGGDRLAVGRGRFMNEILRRTWSSWRVGRTASCSPRPARWWQETAAGASWRSTWRGRATSAPSWASA